MDIVQLLQNLKDSLDALSAQLVDAQAAAKEAYDKGFADGVASVVPPVGPSQADLDAALAKVAELEGQVAALSSQVSDLQSQLAQSVLDAVLKVKEGAKAVVDALELKEKGLGDDAKAQIDAL